MRLARWLAMWGALILVVAVPGTAQAAKPVELFRDTGEFSFTEEVCGLEVEINGTFTVVIITREVPNSDGQAFFGHNTYDVLEVHTNPDTGEQVLIRAKGVFHETSAEHVEGDIWRFKAIDAGTFTLSDSDGNRLLRDRGVVRFTVLFDTLGDSQPGGVVLEEEVTFHGPHADEDTFCNVYVGALT